MIKISRQDPIYIILILISLPTVCYLFRSICEYKFTTIIYILLLISPVFTLVFLYLKTNNISKNIFYFCLPFTLFFYSAFIVHLLNTDNIIYYASQDYPLTEKHIYYLQKNDGYFDKSGKVIVPPNIKYLIVPLLEKGQKQYYGTSGRTIGSTAVNLEPFVNKEVIISGYHYDGKTMFLSTTGLPDHYKKSNWAVIHVKSIKLAR